jgi:hypothetical protein
MNELISSFGQNLNSVIVSALKKLCAGHPGLTRASLVRLQKDFKKGENYLNEEDFDSKVLRFIVDGSLSEKLLNDTRCFVSPEGLSEFLDVTINDIIQLIDMLLRNVVNYDGNCI